MTLANSVRNQIKTHRFLLYMKGTPERPQCGFSKKAVDILKACGMSFYTIDTLTPDICSVLTIDVLNPDIRSTLKEFSGWPTFPQFYVKSELIGGSDILEALYSTGELKTKLTSK